ncbi:LysR family transcriptional regulator [Mycolicibacterium agri]|uniref:LysR family transcriptional regulator n=1 Tax=Mycolicibacterium agri TaxID=36811 RepID=A0A2A7NE11_MYCAG|nr:RidA family protein [Mycolicibacterium agri]PEG41681.1 LysR family transcriptional regulator [Mycolicibacterium agri]GFG50096.1 hypothetical protein MAGR_15370 [Mycolicibacterium agri]
MSTETHADEMGLPAPRVSSSPYLRTVIDGGVIYLSGQLPYVGAALDARGIVGATVSVEAAANAARQCALNALSVLRSELGSLNRVTQLLRLTGYIACTPDFAMQPKVMDAASATFLEYLGSRGQHSRTAVGVCSLPHGAPVEIEVTAAING